MDPFSSAEARVLGALAEKALATPEYYPLSLNALVTACNQKTGREPVMDLSEDEVAEALAVLMRRRLAGTTTGGGSRVEKYRHLLDHAYGLGGPEQAALAVLLLRGPQTAGEVRARTGRLYEFEALEEAEATLHRLANREEPLAVELPVQPGRKEPRFAHLLSGPVDTEQGDAQGEANRAGSLVSLAERVEALEGEVEGLKSAFEAFRRQFE